MNPMLDMPGGWELILILAVVVLLFGAKKLPELARNSGQALRIFKAETKGLLDDDDDDAAAADKPALDAQRSTSEATPVTEGEKRTEEL